MSDHNHSHEVKDVKFEIKRISETEVELHITIEPVRFNQAKDKMYLRLAPSTVISGFRPGKAPRNVIEAKLGPRLFEETINDLLPEVTTEVMLANHFQPLTSAEYNLEKVSDGDGVVYVAKFTIFPELKLPKFKGLKVEKVSPVVTDKEVNDLFDKLKSDILNSRKQAKDSKDSKDSKETKDQKEDESIDWAKELQMEQVTDESSVKVKLKDSLLQRKQDELEDKYNTDLVKLVIEKGKIPAPQALVKNLMASREKDYTSRIENLGLKVDDFLKAQKVDMETLRKNWHTDAEFQIQSDMLFIEIAKIEGITVSQEDVETEINNISDPESKARYQSPEGKEYISSILLRQKSLVRLKEMVAGK